MTNPHPDAPHTAVDSRSDEHAAAIDPVCGMTVDPAKTTHHAEHQGKAYYFCSAGCRTRLVTDPNAYLGTKPFPAPSATPGAMWTCPMHSEIRQQGPGTCPICGMALEPEEPSLDDRPNPELVASLAGSASVSFPVTTMGGVSLLMSCILQTDRLLGVAAVQEALHFLAASEAPGGEGFAAALDVAGVKAAIDGRLAVGGGADVVGQR